MNNCSSTVNSNQIETWAKIIADCKEAKASGIKVLDWLNSQGISRDTYYYWYSRVKSAYLEKSDHEIVPLSEGIISPPTSSAKQHQNICSHGVPVSSIKLSINGITIEVNELVNPELLTNVIKAVRYA